MTSPFAGLEVERALRPSPRAFEFDLDRALSSVVALEARVSEDAFTAETLGTERVGNAIIIGAQGLLVTIGYLVTEADEVQLTTGDGRRMQAHVLGIDQTTGFGLIHALEPLDLPALPLGDSRRLRSEDVVIAAGGGGRAHALAGRLLTRAPFAGYWEYHLDEAMFVEPDHPHWSGAALINAAGALVGVGSLRIEQRTSDGHVRPLNMFVPSQLLAPIVDDLAHGRPTAPARPWLGVFAQELDHHVVVLGVSSGSPAASADLNRGDIIRQVAGQSVTDLASFYTHLWRLGPAGVLAPLTVQRGHNIVDVEVVTVDRASKLKRRRLN